MERWIIGENVPWGVSWTAEDRFDLEPSRAFPGYMDLIQAERPGDGAPRFAAMHVTRQRRGIVDQLCHLCGRRTLTRDRYIFPVESGGFVTVSKTSRYAGSVPPVHLSCGKRARSLCPHLSHALAEPVPYPGEESLVVPRPDIPAEMAELARSLPRGPRIVFACLRVYGPRFSRTVEKMRKARGGRTAETWRAFTA